MNDDAKKSALLLATTILAARDLQPKFNFENPDASAFKLIGQTEEAVKKAYRRSKQILKLIEKEISDDEKYGESAWDYDSKRDGPKVAQGELED